jgi:hypothetical protein
MLDVCALQAELGEVMTDAAAAGAASVAAAALAAGVRPPMLPQEGQLLDRTAWVLQQTAVATLLRDGAATQSHAAGGDGRSSGMPADSLVILHNFLRTGDCNR